MELDKAIKSRTSVRKFKSIKPDWRDILECIDVARYAPMAGNNYSLKFILVDDPETIRKIAQAAQQDFISQAHYVVVFCSTPSRTLNNYGKQGEIIVEVGLSTCWIGYFVENQIKRELDIPKEVNVEAVFPIGFEYEKKRSRKAKIDLDKVLYFNEYGQEKMKKTKKLDV
jgi:nitroreductase